MTYEHLKKDLDWIGVTDKLATETFPLLRAVANTNVEFPTLNSSEKKVRKSQLSAATIEYLENITVADKDMYERASVDFPITMWKNFDSSRATAAAKS